MNIFIRIFEQIIEWLHIVSNDYGVAIVIITIAVRLLLIPLSIKQRKNVGKQKELSEKVNAIRKKYINDKEKQETELAKLYSENGIGMGGCLTSLIQMPVMICLYNAIRNITAIECGTILLPWVSSLLVRDQYFILPIATLVVQAFPQIYPYLSMFSVLKLQKQPGGAVVALLVMNGIFTFMLPTGVGLYYFVSGLFQSAEQFIYNMICVRRVGLQE